MKIEGSIEEMISNLFPNCDVYFDDLNVNCDVEHVLNGNRRSRYKHFHFIHSNYFGQRWRVLKWTWCVCCQFFVFADFAL